MANSEIRAAARTFYREKVYALINLSGLSLAIACSLILGLYLKSELTYDLHNKRHKEIYRVVDEYITSGSTARYAVTPVPLGPMLKEDYPEVKDFVRFSPPQQILISTEDKVRYWDDVCFTDDSVFDIFTFDILDGDPEKALKDRSSAAVSETFAKWYFGDANPIGKTIQTETRQVMPRKIALVFRDLPENTHLKYDVLLRLVDDAPAAARRSQLWTSSIYTYLVLRENYGVKDFKAISDTYFDRYMAEAGRASGGWIWNCSIQPLADIHLHSDVEGDLAAGNRYYIYGFAAVALFILLVACINYVNLAIARAARRSKEIGMRKILGISRSLLIFRFLSESVLFSLAALLLGVAIVELVLKLTPINLLLGTSLPAGVTDEPGYLAGMLGLSLFIGILSGLYPALYLSSIAPLSALSDTHRGRKGGFRLREALVLIQFTVSVIVIACTLLMAMQMHYISAKTLGFAKENRLTVPLRGLDVIEKYDVIKNELLSDSRIRGVTASDFVPGTGRYSVPAAEVENEDGSTGRMGLSNAGIGDDFLEVMGMELVAGRDFSKRLLTDAGRFLVNEAMVRKMGWSDPIGKSIRTTAGRRGRVIGVVKDFHSRSLKQSIEPFAIYPLNDDFSNVPPALRHTVQRSMILHVSEADVRQTLKFLQEKFAEWDPKHPFEPEFLDDTLAELYLDDTHLMKITGIFSGICILISCLGLFGLASFTTEQRNKEIGIRKVVGASAARIILMLSRKILWLVLAGSIVASAVAYYAIDQWMTTGFVYRVGINPLVFALSAAVAIAVAYITIALQSYRTARANPAKMLRYE